MKLFFGKNANNLKNLIPRHTHLKFVHNVYVTGLGVNGKTISHFA